jgi:peptidoglycan/LPS O-acetylase OafA/YrhL
MSEAKDEDHLETNIGKDEPSKKLHYVDTLRGIAVLGVILVHCGDLASSSNAIASVGARGVQLFFVVSSLTLLMSMTSRSAREAHPIRNFFIRRFFRIAPLFYIAICVSLLVDGLSPRYWAPFGLSFSAIPTTLLFVNGWNPYTITSIVPGGWSIAVEMTFYGVLPILFYLVCSFRRAIACWAITVVAACALSPLSAWLAGAACPSYLASAFGSLWFPTQLPVFLSGFMLFFALRDNFRALNFVASQAVCLFFLVVEFLVNRQFHLDLHLHLGMISAGIGASLLAFTLAKTSPRFLVNPVLEHVGIVSFGCYILHFWTIRLLLPLKGTILFLPAPVRLFTAFLIVAVATIIVSTGLHKFIEVPSQNVGRNLINRLGRERKMPFVPIT